MVTAMMATGLKTLLVQSLTLLCSLLHSDQTFPRFEHLVATG